MNVLDSMDTYRTFHPKIAEYTFFKQNICDHILEVCTNFQRMVSYILLSLSTSGLKKKYALKKYKKFMFGD